MKQIVCELCGCTRFSKEDGWFICGGCGTRYSQAEARNMLREVPDAPAAAEPEPAAPAQPPETAERSEKLLLLARRAKESNDSVTAAKYYQELLLEEPENWEAAFYTIYFDAMNGKIAQIGEAAARVSNSLDYVFELIKKRPREEWEKDSVEVVGQVSALARMLAQNAVETITANANGPLYLTREQLERLNREPLTAGKKPFYVEMGPRRAAAGKSFESWFPPLAKMMVQLGEKLKTEMDWSCSRRRPIYEAAVKLIDLPHNMLFRPEQSLLDVNLGMISIGMKGTFETEQEIHRIMDQVNEAARKEEEEQFRAYWEEHAEERSAILAEADELKKRADSLLGQERQKQDEINRISQAEKERKGPLEQQYQELRERIREKETERSALGLFKGKEKQRLTDEIEKLRAQQPDEASRAREKADREQALSERTKPLLEEIGQLRASRDELNRKAEALRAKLTRIPEEKA